MHESAFILSIILVIPAHSQVVDVNNDGIVGPHEAIAVVEHWKDAVSRPNDHNHLGQTWVGNRNPLTIRGNFSPRLIIGTTKADSKGSPTTVFSAPLILDNTATSGSPPRELPDLVLNGARGSIAALDRSGSSMSLLSNNHFELHLDEANVHGGPNTQFRIRNGADSVVLSVNEEGTLFTSGKATFPKSETKIDHPLDPANMYLVHSSIQSPELKNVYDGWVMLDEDGEAVVQLPDYFEAFNADFRYQLTCVGGFAPVYIADEIQENHFKIAGGKPGMKISWQVTGVRQDAYAKSQPVEVEQEKPREEKGRFLHPEIFDEPEEKSVMAVAEE